MMRSEVASFVCNFNRDIYYDILRHVV